MREAIEEAGVRGDLLVRFKGYASSSYYVISMCNIIVLYIALWKARHPHTCDVIVSCEYLVYAM